MTYGTLNVDSVVSSDGTTSGGLYGFKNRIINGAMMIDQRNAGASVSVDGATVFGTDRWKVTDSTDGAFTIEQVEDAPSGFAYSLKVTTTTADASLSATQWSALQQPIEGFNVSDLDWGAASAATVTLSFWVKSSLTGTFGGALGNSALNRGYPFTYTISAANTWEQKAITIAGDTSGTWLKDNGIGLRVWFGLGVGSTYSGTSGAWAASQLFSVTGATSVVGTSGATFYITGVQLEKGSTATSFDYRPYGTELQLCQRYFWNNVGNQSGSYYDTTGVVMYFLNPVPMRTAPTVTAVSLTLDVINVGNPTMTPTPVNTDVTGFRISGIASSGASLGHPAGISNNSARMSISAEL